MVDFESDDDDFSFDEAQLEDDFEKENKDTEVVIKKSQELVIKHEITPETTPETTPKTNNPNPETLNKIDPETTQFQPQNFKIGDELQTVTTDVKLAQAVIYRSGKTFRRARIEKIYKS